MTSYTGVSAKLVFTNDGFAIMEPSKRCYKWCFVPKCTSTTFITPEKTFVTMPRDVKIRKMWFKAARRDYSKITSSDFYCCEDHFDNCQCHMFLIIIQHDTYRKFTPRPGFEVPPIQRTTHYTSVTNAKRKRNDQLNC
ncbi:hypothetical protein RI129_007566 [Pyrocoelia pectoralis]|uniref:THAP-type domain-containing protein n=1 Tax=Pyrocoelia pectoralis TaxID=417401 RepID=A0AAN7VDU5_9COLE